MNNAHENEESSSIYKPLSNATQFNEFLWLSKDSFLCLLQKDVCHAIINNLSRLIWKWSFLWCHKTIFFLNYFVTDTMSCLFSVILELLVQIPTFLVFFLFNIFFNDLKMISTIFFVYVKQIYKLASYWKMKWPLNKISFLLSHTRTLCIFESHVQKVDRERKMTIGSSSRR